MRHRDIYLNYRWEPGDSRSQGPRVPPQETTLPLLCSFGLHQVKRELYVQDVVFLNYYFKIHIAGSWLSFYSDL